MEAGKAKQKLYPVKLMFDYWDGPGYIDETTGEHVDNRIKAGTVIELPVDEALRSDRGQKGRADGPASMTVIDHDGWRLWDWDPATGRSIWTCQQDGQTHLPGRLSGRWRRPGQSGNAGRKRRPGGMASGRRSPRCR